MKNCLAFVTSFLLTLFVAVQFPSVKDGIKNHLLSYLQKEMGIEVQGEFHLKLFPFELELEKVVFDPKGRALFKAEILTLGLGTFYIQLKDFIDLKGNFWVEEGGLKLQLDQEGDFGNFHAEGTLNDWKIDWHDPRFGSAIAYLSVSWEKEGLMLSSLEAAGTFLERNFTLEGSGELQHPLVELHFTASQNDPVDGELGLILYRYGPLWEGNVSFVGELHDMPLQADGLVSLLEGESIAIKEGTLSWGTGVGSLEALLDLKKSLFEASLTLATDDLPPFIAAKGDLLAKASFITPLDKNYFPLAPQLEVDLYTQTLDMGGLTLIDGEGLLYLAEEHGTPEWRLKAHLEKLKIGHETFENFSFSNNGRIGELSPFNMKIEKEGEKIAVSGEVSPTIEGVRLFFQSIEGRIYHLPISLEETGFLSFYPDGWRLDRLHLHAGQTSIKWQGRGNQGEVAFQGEILRSSLQEFFPTLVGSAVGTMEIVGPWSDLEALLALQLKNVTLLSVELPCFPLAGSLNLQLKNEQVTFKNDLKGIGGEAIVGEGQFSLNQPFLVRGEVSFSGELAPFLALVLPDTTSASGLGKGKFNLTGSLTAPLINGQLSLKNGSYEDLITGMIYRQLESEFVFEGNNLLMKKLKAFDRRGYEIAGEGEMQFSENYPFKLDLETKGGEVLNLDYVVGRASGKVALVGNRDGGKLSGNLTVDEMSILLPEKTPIIFQTLDVIYEKIDPVEEKIPWRLVWDLHLDVPNPVQINGNSFSSYWKGDFNLQGSTESPLLFGKGKLVNASFSVNSKTFNSNEGMILFQGEPSSKSTFYITAKQEIEDLKIEIILKGLLKSPELTFRSNPAKSSREILSYLLFNRGLGEITPYEGEELTQSIIKLDSTTTSSDPNLLDRLKSGLGIDRLEISGEKELGPENVSVEVGKYLSPQLYFCLKKSVSDGPNQAAIEAKLPHHFKAQAEVGDDAEGKFMLKWEHDY
jgi:hypothetical protein